MADPKTLAAALASIESDPYSRGDLYGGLEPNPGHTISSYTPNMRENLSRTISDIFGNPRGVDRVLNRMDAIGLNPAGWLDSARDAGRFIGEAVQSNNLNDAAGNIGLGTLAAVGAIPGLPGKKAPLNAVTNEYRLGLSTLENRINDVASGLKPRPATQTTSQFYTPGENYAALLRKAEEGGHLFVDKNGKIIGAPNTFTNPNDIEAVRRSSDDLVKLGAPYREWYDDAAEAVKLFSPTVNMEKALPIGMGRMSPNSSPDFATESTIRMLNNLSAGESRKPFGLTVHANNFLDQFPAVSSGVPTSPGQSFTEIMPTSNKVAPYTIDLRTGGADPRTVNDLWRGRAQGYPENASSGSFNPAQHNYMWGEGVLAADRANAGLYGGLNNWNPASVQAAEWVGKRARSDMAERDARITALNANKNISSTERQKLINLEPSDSEVLSAANEPIRSTLDKRVVNVAVEAVPGRGLGHFENIIDAPEAERVAFSKPRLDAFVTQANTEQGIKPGYDRLYTELGYPQRPVQSATGSWTAPGSSVVEYNPVHVAGPVMSTLSGRKSELSKANSRTIDAVETLRGSMLAQHAVGQSRVIPLSRKAASQNASGLSYQGADPAGAVKAFESAGLHALDVGDGRVVAGRFFDPMRPKDILAAGDSVASAGFPNNPGLFYANLTEAPKRNAPGTVTANIASKFRSNAGERVAEQLDGIVRPIADTLKNLNQSVTNYGPSSKTIDELLNVLGKDGLVNLVQATRGMTKKNAISYYASRGLPAIGAFILSEELASQMAAPLGDRNGS